MRLRQVGDAAVVIDVESLEAAHRLWHALRADPPPGLREVVVGAASVLVQIDPVRCDPADLRERLQAAAAPAPAPVRTVQIPVVYDGADLGALARESGLSPAELIERHVRGTYRVAFLGFSPGFAYLSGLDEVLVRPRRADPRTRVPAGSVAIAGEYTAVYPQDTPGGWHLLGRTELSVFDPSGAEPALLRPGDRVRFRAVGGGS